MLKLRAQTSDVGRYRGLAVGLSWMTQTVQPRGRVFPPRQLTSWAPKRIRGHVQHCLHILAREGIMFSRTKPEGDVEPYAHGESDKYFPIRISQLDAQRMLKRMKVGV